VPKGPQEPPGADTAVQPSRPMIQLDTSQQQQIAMAQAALTGGAPRYYANGFIMAQSLADLSVVLLTNGAASGVLTLSMISAKTLAVELANIVEGFEKSTGQKIPSMAEVEQKMKESHGSPNAS
jgi:hypothetical protein